MFTRSKDKNITTMNLNKWVSDNVNYVKKKFTKRVLVHLIKYILFSVLLRDVFYDMHIQNYDIWVEIEGFLLGLLKIYLDIS